MGIQGLMKFIQTKFPQCITKRSINNYQGKALAIDASNWIYQFLIKTQTIKTGNVSTPMDSMGHHTGHLIGILARIVMCMESNITTVWVFDGSPPQQKYNQLRRRKLLKQYAQEKVQQAKEQGQEFDLLKMSQRTVKISQTQKNYAKKLVQLIGLPMIQSPSQAEPQCAQITKSGLVDATVSQDMDTLAFGCPKIIRHFSKPEQTCEVQLKKLLQLSNLTYQQFVDLCILCGCDYSSRIRSIGPIRAYEYIKKYKNIDNVLQYIVKDEKLRKKHTFDDDFNYFAARKIFQTPQVTKLKAQDFKVGQFRQQQIFEFLLERDFSESRINNWMSRVKKTNYLNH